MEVVGPLSTPPGQRNTAHGSSGKVMVAGADADERAKSFVARLLPLAVQRAVRDLETK